MLALPAGVSASSPVETASAGLVDVIDETEEDEQRGPASSANGGNNGLMTTAAAERAVVVNGRENFTDNDDDESSSDNLSNSRDSPSSMTQRAQVVQACHQPNVPPSMWLMPEVIKRIKFSQPLFFLFFYHYCFFYSWNEWLKLYIYFDLACQTPFHQRNRGIWRRQFATPWRLPKGLPISAIIWKVVVI